MSILTRNICFGVTGLRRTGKTVFLTALIHHLKTLGNQGMKAFGPTGLSKRIELRAATISLMNNDGQAFPYHENLAALQGDPPAWPPPTRVPSHAQLEFQTENPRFSKWHPRRFQRIRLHLYDYPGEFLLDIPMHRQTFDQWSQDTLGRMARNQGSLAAVQSYLQEVSRIDGDDLSLIVRRLRQLYADYIVAAWKGRYEFVTPAICLADPDPNADIRDRIAAQLANESSLPFVPVPPRAISYARLAGIFEPAYTAYVDNRVRPFLAELRRCREQLVLVDILRILQQGPKSYNDFQECLTAVMSSFKFAGWFLPGVRRVFFAATKADHALVHDRQNLVVLLRSAVLAAKGAIPAPIAADQYFALSSIRATQDRIGQFQGKAVNVLYGTPTDADDGDTGSFNPGVVPPDWNIKDWKSDDERYQFPSFKSRGLPHANGVQWDYLGLDEVVCELLRPYLYAASDKNSNR